MPPEQPMAIVLGGVNGAGKSTSARALLAEQLKVTAFVNADEIARGLSAFAPEAVAFTAGRVMLARLRELQMRVPTSRLKRRWPGGLTCRFCRI